MVHLFVILLIAASSPLLFVVGQQTYRALTEIRRKRWERKIKRDASGTRIDCKPYQLDGASNKAILLVHGFADSPVIFHKLAEHFQAQGITAKAILLPGFGVPTDKQADINENLWIDAIEEEIAPLTQNHAEVWLAAHSLGCAITLHWLTRTSKQVKGVFLLAPLIKVSNHRSFLLPPATWFRFGQRFFKHIHVLENVLPCDIRNPSPANHLPTDRFIHFSVYDALFNLVDSFKEPQMTITVPTIVYLAEHDHIVDNAATHRLFEQINVQQLEIITMKESGHVLTLDYEWEDIARDITSRIQRKNGSGLPTAS